MPRLSEETFDQPQSFLIKTRELMAACDKSINKLCQETGLPYPWLRSFKNGAIDNPSVNRVQFLYEHLNGGELKLNA
jgi:hypothetical protein